MKALHEGEVTACHGERLAVQEKNGNILYLYSRRRFGVVVPGDIVQWQDRTDDHSDSPTDKQASNRGQITAVQPRRTMLGRQDRRGQIKPVAANIDQLVIIAAHRPAFDSYLIDQYIVAAYAAGVDCCLVLNKADLWEDQALAMQQWSTLYQNVGFTVLHTSIHQPDSVQKLQQQLARTSVFVGLSGVGKSSLIAALTNKHITTGAIGRHGQGSHTTSTAQLYQLTPETRLIDSPGVREFRVGYLPIHSLLDAYPDITSWAQQCHFPNCSHDHEPRCAVRKAVQEQQLSSRRYNNFLRMLQENIAMRPQHNTTRK